MKRLTILFVLTLLLLPTASTIKAEDYEDENGEIRLEINHERLPTIGRNWTSINLTVRDITGIDWERFISKWDPMVFWKNFTYSHFWMNYVWEKLGIDPDILGYNSFQIDINILSDNPEGWNAKIEPGNIPKTTTYYNHSLTLSVKTTDLCVDYNPTLELVFTRTGRLGQPIAQTKAYIPLKAEIASFSLLQTPIPTQTVSPKTIFALPFSITHKGEYSTTYHLKAEYPNDLVVQLSDQYVTLQPNEVKTCELVVLSPECFYEPGANYPVTVTAISEDGSAIHSAEFIIISQGFYFSILFYVQLLVFFLLLIILYLVVRISRKILKKRQKTKENIKEKIASQQERSKISD